MGKVSVKHQENLRLEASLFHLHKQFQAAGDEQQAAKAIQLLKKVGERRICCSILRTFFGWKIEHD